MIKKDSLQDFLEGVPGETLHERLVTYTGWCLAAINQYDRTLKAMDLQEEFIIAKMESLGFEAKNICIELAKIRTKAGIPG